MRTDGISILEYLQATFNILTERAIELEEEDKEVIVLSDFINLMKRPKNPMDDPDYDYDEDPRNKNIGCHPETEEKEAQTDKSKSRFKKFKDKVNKSDLPSQSKN